MKVIEFAHSNSFQASIGMAPFETLYGRQCKSPIEWFEVDGVKVLSPDLVLDALYKVKTIRESCMRHIIG